MGGAYSHEDLIAKEEIQDSCCSNVYLHTSTTAGNVICSSLEFVKISLECIDEDFIAKEEIQDTSCSNVYLHISTTAGNVICSSLAFVKISLDYPGGIIDRVH